MLDKFILDDQGELGQYHDYTKGEQLEKTKKDFSNMDFHWSGTLFRNQLFV